MTDRQPMKSNQRSKLESSSAGGADLEGSPHLRPGDLLADRYAVQQPIGAGGMGEVWLATDRVTRNDVAIKVLADALATQPGFAALLAAEAQTLHQLTHPNIVKMLDHGEQHPHFYIVFEYLSGDSLVSMRGAQWQKIVELVLPIASALEYAHALGIVHRDLKPGNILFDGAGEPRLADFGIAAKLGQASETGARGGGSLPAMSPQQLAGESPCVADDIYSLGALLYDLLSGAPLFTPGADPDAVRHQIPRPIAELALAGPVPKGLSDLVQRALAKQPQHRPATMRECRQRLQELLKKQPESALGKV